MDTHEAEVVQAVLKLQEEWLKEFMIYSANVDSMKSHGVQKMHMRMLSLDKQSWNYIKGFPTLLYPEPIDDLELARALNEVMSKMADGTLKDLITKVEWDD